MKINLQFAGSWLTFFVINRLKLMNERAASSVLTHLFLPVCPPEDDWHRGRKSLLFPVEAREYWNPHFET